MTKNAVVGSVLLYLITSCSSEPLMKCSPPQVMCGDSCVSVINSRLNCGSCGNECMVGQYCEVDRCVACQNECVVGEVRCKPNAMKTVQQCGDANADTCLEWSQEMLCTSGQICRDGACTQSECIDECAASPDRICSQTGAPGYFVCGQFDSDPCRDLGPFQACASNEKCENGVCKEIAISCQGSADVCDDGDGCTRDECNTDTNECEHFVEPIPGAEDGLKLGVCTNGLDDDCDGLVDLQDPDCGECAVDLDCDDNNACTLDSCAGKTCLNEPKADGTVCDDGQFCSVNDRCTQGICVGEERDCEDGDHCTLDSCSESQNRCVSSPIPNPDDEGPADDVSCFNGQDDDCDGKVDQQDPDCVPTATCGGAMIDGHCWYIADQGQSCRSKCAAHGGYDQATRTYAGFPEGSRINCRYLGEILTPSKYFYGNYGVGYGLGCFVYVVENDINRDNQRTTTADAYSGRSRRFCACLR